jgi:hypothetical protein
METTSCYPKPKDLIWNACNNMMSKMMCRSDGMRGNVLNNTITKLF